MIFFIVISAVLGALIGLWKGFRKTLSGLTASILAAVISLLITPPIIRAIITEEMALNLAQTFGIIETYNELATASPALVDLILSLPVALIAPIVFLIFYGLIRLIFRIVLGIVSKKVLKTEEKEKTKEFKLIGTSIGLVRGAITAMVFVFVIAGYVNTVNTVTNIASEEGLDNESGIVSSISTIDEYVNVVADDFVVSGLNSGNFVYDHLTSLNIEGESVKLNQEIGAIADAAIQVLPITENLDLATWTNEEIDCLRNFVDNFGTSKTLPTISAELLSSACKKWAVGEAFLGMKAPEADENVSDLLNALYQSLSTSTKATITEDLGTVVDILGVMTKYEVLKKLGDDGAELTSFLSSDFVSETLTVISKNERFSVLVPEITNLSMKMLASALNLPKNTEEVYQNVMNNLSGSLSNVMSGDRTEESVEQFKSDVVSSLNDNGIKVDEEVANVVSEGLISAFEGKSEVTEKDIQDYFEDYANVYGIVESETINTASKDDSIKLSTPAKAPTREGSIDYSSMTYEQKLEALASIGLLDYCNDKNDLSSKDNVLANGMTAEKFVDYILSIYNSVVSNYEKISAMGKAEENPLLALASPETIITTKTTAEDLVVKNDSYQITEQEIEKIASSVESIVTFLDSYSKIEGTPSLENLADLDLGAAGKALDTLKETEIFSETIDKLADTLVNNVVGSDVGLSDKINESDATFESLMNTVQSASSVIAGMTSTNKTEDEKKQSVIELLTTITPANASIVTEIVNKDFIIGFGVPAEYAEASAKALRIALIEMANLPEAEHDKEAAKLTYLFEIASASKDSSKPMIGEDGIFKSEHDVIDMIVNSKVAYETLNELSYDDNGAPIKDALGLANKLTDSNKESLSKAIVEYFNTESGSMSAAEVEILKAELKCISLIFDIDINL